MEDIEVEAAEPTGIQLEIEQMAIEGLQQTKVETEKLSEVILNSMRLRTDESGALVRMTDEEYVATLGEAEAQNFRNFQEQIDRQTRALEGTLPVSKGLRRQEEDIIKETVEAGNRLGQGISGTTLEDLTATTTSGSQRVRDLRSSLLLARDAERRGEIQTGQANIGQNLGIIKDVASRDVAEKTAFPSRNLFALNPFVGQTGLLNQQSMFNAQAQAQQRSDIYGLAGTVGGLGLYGLLSRPKTP